MCPSRRRVLLSFLSSPTKFVLVTLFFLLHLSPHCSHLLLFAPFGCWKIDNENKSAVTKERSSRVHFDVRAVCSEAKV